MYHYRASASVRPRLFTILFRSIFHQPRISRASAARQPPSFTFHTFNASTNASTATPFAQLA
jgi:hypothetical protein